MSTWDNLSIQEKNDIMKVAIRNGITNLADIRETYNSFAGGGFVKPDDPPGGNNIQNLVGDFFNTSSSEPFNKDTVQRWNRPYKTQYPGETPDWLHYDDYFDNYNIFPTTIEEADENFQQEWFKNNPDFLNYYKKDSIGTFVPIKNQPVPYWYSELSEYPKDNNWTVDNEGTFVKYPSTFDKEVVKAAKEVFPDDELRFKIYNDIAAKNGKVRTKFDSDSEVLSRFIQMHGRAGNPKVIYDKNRGSFSPTKLEMRVGGLSSYTGELNHGLQYLDRNLENYGLRMDTSDLYRNQNTYGRGDDLYSKLPNGLSNYYNPDSFEGQGHGIIEKAVNDAAFLGGSYYDYLPKYLEKAENTRKFNASLPIEKLNGNNPSSYSGDAVENHRNQMSIFNSVYPNPENYLNPAEAKLAEYSQGGPLTINKFASGGPAKGKSKISAEEAFNRKMRASEKAAREFDEMLRNAGIENARHRAAILGNVQQESGFNPTIRNATNHLGYVQMSGDNQKYMRSLGYDPTSPKDVAEFLGRAYNGTLPNGGGGWNKAFEGFKNHAGDSEDIPFLAHTFEKFIERSGGSAMQNRADYADWYWKNFYDNAPQKQVLMNSINESSNIPVPQVDYSYMPTYNQPIVPMLDTMSNNTLLPDTQDQGNKNLSLLFNMMNKQKEEPKTEDHPIVTGIIDNNLFADGGIVEGDPKKSSFWKFPFNLSGSAPSKKDVANSFFKPFNSALDFLGTAAQKIGFPSYAFNNLSSQELQDIHRDNPDIDISNMVNPVVVKPNWGRVKRAQEMIPDKRVRHDAYNWIQYTNGLTRQNYDSDAEVVDRLYNLYVRAGRPNMNYGRGREYTETPYTSIGKLTGNNGRSTFQNISDFPDYMAETSHALQLHDKNLKQFNLYESPKSAEEMYKKYGSGDDYYRSSIGYNTNYNNPNYDEAQAHNIIEPAMWDYIFMGGPSYYSYIPSYQKGAQNTSIVDNYIQRKYPETDVKLNDLTPSELQLLGIDKNSPFMVSYDYGRNKLYQNGGHLANLFPGGGKLDTSNYGINIYPYLFALDGVKGVRASSGRRPGAKTKQGRLSRHGMLVKYGNNYISGAFDLVGPFDEMRKVIYDPTSHVSKFMRQMNHGLIDETTKEMMAQTGATGKHFHIGGDSYYANAYDKKMDEISKKLEIPEGYIFPDEAAAMAKNDTLMNTYIPTGGAEIASNYQQQLQGLNDLIAQYNAKELLRQQVEEERAAQLEEARQFNRNFNLAMSYMNRGNNGNSFARNAIYSLVGDSMFG